MPNNVLSCQHHQKRPKKCQTLTYMPNTIFSCQATLKKAKFLEFGLKKCQLSNPGEGWAVLTRQRKDETVELLRNNSIVHAIR